MIITIILTCMLKTRQNPGALEHVLICVKICIRDMFLSLFCGVLFYSVMLWGDLCGQRKKFGPPLANVQCFI